MGTLKRRFGSLETRFWEPLDGSGHLETVFSLLLFGVFLENVHFAKIAVLLRENFDFRGFGHIRGGQVGLGTAVSEPLGRQVGFGSAVSGALWRFGRLETSCWWLLDGKLALKRCFGNLEMLFWEP